MSQDLQPTELHIKNMVCDRCIMVVRQTLESLGLDVVELELGRVVVESDGPLPLEDIDEELQKVGFELLRGSDQQFVERVKALLIAYVGYLEENEESPRVSDYLAERLHRSYSNISSLFSENEDSTIERYLIHLKIERVKELLSYGDMTLSEIAHQLNYSSVSHLSNQFRKITGMSVTDYKKARDTFRKSLDSIDDPSQSG